MKSFFPTLALVLATFLTPRAQQLTIAEATNGLYSTLAPQSLRNTSWQPNTAHLYFTSEDQWMRYHAVDNRFDTLLPLSRLNSLLNNDDTLKRFPTIVWTSNTEAYFRNNNNLYILSVHPKSIEVKKQLTIPKQSSNLTVDPNGKKFAYTVENNLWILGEDGTTRAVTNDDNKDIINGQSVHRDEFGIDRGIFFSPKGNLLAYYRMDQTMVKEYPVINWNSMPAQNNSIRYPMAGDTSHQVTLHVFNPSTGATTAIQTGEPKDQYLTCVSWSPDEKYLFIGVLNRAQNHLKLNQYDASTGKFVHTLFEETDMKYVEPQHALSFLPESNDQFIWWSQRDGYMHLYLYKTDGTLVRQLTSGKWIVNELIGFNSKNKEVIYTSSEDSPLEKHSYAVNWNNGKKRRLDKEPGVHNLISSTDGKYLLDVYSNSKTPRNTIVRTVDGKQSRMLLESSDPLATYVRPEVRNIRLFTADSTELYGKLILPIDFDSTKKYPVIVYLYNGPHLQLVKNQYPASGNLWYDYMAQKGYLVFSMDGRGSANRGLAFEQAVHRQLGTVELSDQLLGVSYLASLGYADTSRMGIFGWSFGGFMSTSMMLRHPGVFKAAVAGGPVTDWRMYEVMYTERYMGQPQNNEEGYANSALGDKAEKLEGKLLLIHGTDDDVVVWQHSLSLLKKFIDAGVQVDYFVYPGHQHNVRGKDRVHLMQKISDYFDLHLK